MAKKNRISLRKVGNLARCIWRIMNSPTSPAPNHIDPAAVFASALSLWNACHLYAKRTELNLSDSLNGIDELMRLVVRVANQFETWSCQHVDFNELTDVWPYMLEDKFGDACVDIISPALLDSFNNRDCFRVAMRLRLPIIRDGNLPIPVDVTAPNPTPNSLFRSFRIQTVRTSNEYGDVSVYAWDDDPFDGEFSEPYFGLYGVFEDGTVEHIADRRTYLEAVFLAKNLAPTVGFAAD